MANAALSSAASGAAAGTEILPGWGTVIGGAAGLLSGLLNKQKAPKKVPYTPVDLQAEQQKAIQGDLGAEDSIETLLSRADGYTQDKARTLMERAVPGFGKLSQKFLSLAGNNLDNPYALPADVSSNLTRLAAEKGISTGVRGQAGDFSALRDLGVNMLDYGNSRINQAQSLLSTIVGLSPRVSPMSPLSFYVTPGQQATTTERNNLMQQGIDQGSENATAAAGNWNTANMWDNIAKAAGMFGSVFDARGGSGRAGVGAPTTYEDFIKNNPSSSAALGR